MSKTSSARRSRSGSSAGVSAESSGEARSGSAPSSVPSGEMARSSGAREMRGAEVEDEEEVVWAAAEEAEGLVPAEEVSGEPLWKVVSALPIEPSVPNAVERVGPA